MDITARVRLSVGSLLLLLLTACGGGGGGGGNESGGIDSGSGTVLAGMVEDGPVAGAYVFLADEDGSPAMLCGDSGQEACEALTADDGSFAFSESRLPAGLNFSIVARGGRDLDSGLDLAGRELSVPLASFAGREGALVISPVTTLLTGALTAPGTGLADAEARVRAWLGLASAADLYGRPSAAPQLQRLSLLLMKISLEREKNGRDPALAALAEALTAEPLVAGGEVRAEVLAALGIAEPASNQVRELFQAMQNQADPAAVFRREELANLVTATLENMLEREVFSSRRMPVSGRMSAS